MIGLAIGLAAGLTFVGMGLMAWLFAKAAKEMEK